MILPGEAPFGMAFDGPEPTFLSIGVRGHALHRNAMDGHGAPRNPLIEKN